MVKKLKTEKEKKEIEYGIQMRMNNSKMDYIKNIINGRYFFARCNMMAAQLNKEEIIEKIDGCLKSKEFMLSEYALMKYQAITSYRNAHFAKQDLMKDFKLTEEDIKEFEDDYYNGKVIREDYDESFKKGTKAEFTESDKK